MAVSPEYTDFIEELFEPFGPIKIKSMFGGAGVFAPLPDGDLMFGLIVSETLYLKVDDSNRADFAEEGKGPFVYERKGRGQAEMSYYELPESLYDDPEAFAGWARKAMDVALRARKPKRKRKAAKK